jgi:hypothetical protein
MKRKLRKIGSNEIDPATTTNKDWGFNPVPNKGGFTTNHAIPNGTFERELKELKEAIINA